MSGLEAFRDYQKRLTILMIVSCYICGKDVERKVKVKAACPSCKKARVDAAARISLLGKQVKEWRELRKKRRNYNEEKRYKHLTQYLTMRG